MSGYIGVGVYKLPQGGWRVSIGNLVVSKHRSLAAATKNAIRVAVIRRDKIDSAVKEIMAAQDKKTPPGKPGGV